MPPKKPTSEQGAVVVDTVTVPYSIDLKTKLVTVGTGVVSNSERDTFRQKASPLLEDQIKARPKWLAILTAAKAAPDDVDMDEQQPTLPPPPTPQSRELDSLLKAMPPPPPRAPPAPPPTSSAAASTVPAVVAAAAAHSFATGTRKIPRKIGDNCRFCLAQGPDFSEGMQRYPSSGEVMIGCSCGACFCNTVCARRGPCPNHWDGGAEASWDFMYRTYAEVLAGIGCKCKCCLEVPTYYIEQIWGFDEETSTIDEDAIQDWDKQCLKDALSAVGHPRSHLAIALATMGDADGMLILGHDY